MVQFSRMKNRSHQVRPDACFRFSERAHYVRMDTQIIVADMNAGHYLGLDGVGARTWDLIGEGVTYGRIIEHLSAEYEVALDVLERDVEMLLQDLLRRGLIRRGFTKL